MKKEKKTQNTVKVISNQVPFVVRQMRAQNNTIYDILVNQVWIGPRLAVQMFCSYDADLLRCQNHELQNAKVKIAAEYRVDVSQPQRIKILVEMWTRLYPFHIFQVRSRPFGRKKPLGKRRPSIFFDSSTNHKTKQHETKRFDQRVNA